MKKYVFIFTIIFSFNSFGQDISQIANIEFNSLTAFFNIDSQLLIKKEAKIKSNRDGTIIVGLDQLNKIANVPVLLEKMLLVRLILCHELGHQLQFSKYSSLSKEMNISNDYSKMIIESQADILAGYLWSYSLFNDAFNKGYTFNDLNEDSLYILLQKIMNLGIKENTVGSHPSKNDRLLSLTQGMRLGIYAFMYTDFEKNPNTFKAGSHEQVSENLKKALIQVNFKKGEGIVRWAYKFAEKVINSNPSVLKDIVLIHESEQDNIKWHKTQDYPYVDYSLSYLNIGEKEISVNMEVHTSHVKENNPERGLYYKKLNTENYSFNIKQGEIYYVKGKLRWDKFDGDFTDESELSEYYYPKLIFPGTIENKDALISGNYIVEPELKPRDSLIKDFGLSSNTSDKKRGATLEFLIRKLKYNPTDLKSGLGSYFYYPTLKFIVHSVPISFGESSGVKINTFLNMNSTKDKFIIDYHELDINYDTLSSSKETFFKYKELVDFCDLNFSTYKKASHNNSQKLFKHYLHDGILIEVFIQGNENGWEKTGISIRKN